MSAQSNNPCQILTPTNYSNFVNGNLTASTVTQLINTSLSRAAHNVTAISYQQLADDPNYKKIKDRIDLDIKDNKDDLKILIFPAQSTDYGDQKNIQEKEIFFINNNKQTYMTTKSLAIRELKPSYLHITFGHGKPNAQIVGKNFVIAGHAEDSVLFKIPWKSDWGIQGLPEPNDFEGFNKLYDKIKHQQIHITKIINVYFKFNGRKYTVAIDGDSKSVMVKDLIQKIKNTIGNDIEVSYNGQKLEDGDTRALCKVPIPNYARLEVKAKQVQQSMNQSVQNQNNTNSQQNNTILTNNYDNMNSGYNNLQNTTTSQISNITNNANNLHLTNSINTPNTTKQIVNNNNKKTNECLTVSNANNNKVTNTFNPPMAQTFNPQTAQTVPSLIKGPIPQQNPNYPTGIYNKNIYTPKNYRPNARRQLDHQRGLKARYIPHPMIIQKRTNSQFKPPIIMPKHIVRQTFTPPIPNQVILSSPNIINTNKPLLNGNNLTNVPMTVQSYNDNNTHFVRNVPIYADGKKKLTNVPVQVQVPQVQTAPVPMQALVPVQVQGPVPAQPSVIPIQPAVTQGHWNQQPQRNTYYAYGIREGKYGWIDQQTQRIPTGYKTFINENINLAKYVSSTWIPQFQYCDELGSIFESDSPIFKDVDNNLVTLGNARYRHP